MILTHAELAEREAGGTNEGITQTRAAAQSAALLSRELQALGRASGEAKRPLPLAPLVESVVRLLRSSLGPKIEIEWEVSPTLAVLGNRDQLKRVLVNLALNARNAMPAGGVLSLRARYVDRVPEALRAEPPADGYVVLEVQDTGIGMPPTVRERLFEPYFTRNGDQGTGLGAAVAYGIVREHNGTIAVDSTPGRGTTLAIYLPAADISQHAVA